MLAAPLCIEQNRSQLCILLVDDEPDIRDLLGILLADLGYEVRSAENGEAACKSFRCNPPDIILTDIKMPGMDGIELLRTVKKEAPEIEVIMISGHGDMQLAIESLKLNAADFITKPIDDDILSIALDKVTEKILLRRQVREYTENLEQMVEEQSARMVELERKVAVQQVVEGLSSAMGIISGDINDEGLFNELPCFISIHSSDLKIITSNELFTNRFGNLNGESSRSIYKDFSGQGSCPVYQAIATRSGGRGNATLIAEDGSEIPAVVYTAPITCSRDKISLVLEVAMDVSEVNRLRTELVQTQKKYEHLFNQVPCYITLQDRDLRIVEANERFRNDFGFDRGTHCHQAYKNREEECEDCPVRKTFDDGGFHQNETVVTTKNGEQYNILVWTAPVFNDAGEVEHVLEVSTNITMVRDLQDQLTSMGMMLGSMSHGIKGLLGALDGGIYRVDAGLKKQDMERIDKGWKVVKHRIGHMKKMVLDTLYYAKTRDLDYRPIKLGDFAAYLAETIAPKAAEHDIRLIRDFSHSDQIFHADPDALAPALINFLENGVDACLYDRSKTEHAVTFCVYVSDSEVHFKISDNGTGMDRETRENMFSLFFSSKGANGTGIGLFISNQIIERHKGTIEVESTVGTGTSFHIRLPSS
ncbi:ATP-binding response regulator [Maridesulfovibrio salexigens]|uniref:histidine kinase n=1 Tax=Maridesulfovibrio salexigens (strain ATCC 14822 / DSM 2638 / NCIMB 8403 / VKM B-1763) TaxID=526222 RepID=C6BWG9_MARSD|nr:response regulator [Maridesulfovibrio salexigens]ACS78413.1 multi-sensor signal transduction histidine kinase [Maridesulfovibrio salexigens DSM 2638]